MCDLFCRVGSKKGLLVSGSFRSLLTVHFTMRRFSRISVFVGAAVSSNLPCNKNNIHTWVLVWKRMENNSFDPMWMPLFDSVLDTIIYPSVGANIEREVIHPKNYWCIQPKKSYTSQHLLGRTVRQNVMYPSEVQTPLTGVYNRRGPPSYTPPHQEKTRLGRIVKQNVMYPSTTAGSRTPLTGVYNRRVPPSYTPPHQEKPDCYGKVPQ